MRITLVAYEEGFHCLTTVRVHIEKQGISLLPNLATILTWNAWIRCCNSHLLSEWFGLDCDQNVEVQAGQFKYVLLSSSRMLCYLYCKIISVLLVIYLQDIC